MRTPSGGSKEEPCIRGKIKDEVIEIIPTPQKTQVRFAY
jgi:hypothetical protein